jgi:DNA invertase Pin-like site-specific DNA recombinase
MNKGPLPRRVELIRVSSAGQAARDTPEDQRRALDRLRKIRPATIVERIEAGAEGLSGALSFENRPDLIRLRELSEAKAYDELAVRHLNRLTRHEDPGERAMILSLAWRARAVIVKADGSIIDPRTPGGEVTFMVETGGGARERVEFAERAKEARQRLAAKGEWQGPRPYGRRWNKETKTWSIVEDEAKIYRRLFEEVAAGTSMNQLAKILTAEKVPTPKIGKGRAHNGWSAGIIKSLLDKPNAYGECTTAGIPVRILPVVSKKLFDRAKVARGAIFRDGRPPGTVTIFALFRGSMVCGTCGSAIWVQHNRKRRNGRSRYSYYRCRYWRTARASGCRKTHPVEGTDQKGAERFLAWLEAEILPTASIRPDPRAAIGNLETQLAQINAETKRLLAAIAFVSDPEITNNALAEIDARRKEINHQLTELRGLPITPPSAAVDAEKRAELLKVAKKAKPDRLREMILAALEPTDVLLLPGGDVQIRATQVRAE